MREADELTLDDAIEIDLQAAVNAYDSFQPLQNGRTHRRSDGTKVALFNRSLKQIVIGLRASVSKGEVLLGSKQTISKWRLGRVSAPIKRRLSVCLAILAVTGKDTTKRQILARRAISFSDLVQLGSTHPQKVTNNPEEISDVTYSSVLQHALFKTARTRVMSSWVKDTRDRRQDRQIGTVDYALREANIRVLVEDGEVSQWLRRFPSVDEDRNGRADGCVVLWSDQDGCWIIQPTNMGHLQARVENLELCRVRASRGAVMQVAVTASRDQIEDNFQLNQVVGEGAVELRDDQKALARNRLIGLVVGQHTKGEGMLAIQRVKLP
ncbi:hypothetical protein [Roseobacter fucihabitans]|uniref:hypothetical protein n=1 Tax=Roseobacter fucihabitans TaxID=1537242 RepID=UPI001652F7C8|nr:hypothetical protein [Roseobacter litoralis]